MRKLSPQIKINIIATAYIVAFLMFWFLFYLPTKTVITKLKDELGGLQDQIGQIEDKVGGSSQMGKGILLLEKRFRELIAKFTSKEEEALRMLSDLADKYHVGNISIKSQPKTPFLDEKGQEVKAEGKICQKFLVSMEMEVQYKDLVDYIEALNEYLSAYLIVEAIHIQKETPGSLKLNVVLDAYLHLLL